MLSPPKYPCGSPPTVTNFKPIHQLINQSINYAIIDFRNSEFQIQTEITNSKLQKLEMSRFRTSFVYLLEVKAHARVSLSSSDDVTHGSVFVTLA